MTEFVQTTWDRTEVPIHRVDSSGGRRISNSGSLRVIGSVDTDFMRLRANDSELFKCSDALYFRLRKD